MDFGFTRLPWIRRFAQSDSGIAARTAIDRAFRSRGERERERIFYGFVRAALINRLIYRFHTALPKLSAIPARLVGIDVDDATRRALAVDGPVIIAAMHFGPIFYQLHVARRLMPDRPFYVLYAERGRDRESCERFMHAIGTFPLLDDPNVSRELERILRDVPNAAVMIAFDFLSRGRRPIPFLETSIDVADGIGFLAQRSSAPVFSWAWERDRFLPRIVVRGPHPPDTSLPASESRRAFVDGLFRLVEMQIRARPSQWNQWPYTSGAAAAPAERSAEAS